MKKGLVKNIVIASIFALAFVIVLGNSCTVISPSQRGVAVTLGKVKGNVLTPGMVWHAPFVTEIRKFKLEPKTYEVTFSCSSDGAITKDMQTVGATVAVRYIYDENRIMDIVTRYQSDSIIESAMKDNVKASLKETTGKYSIYELVAQQNEITTEVATAMLDRMRDYPIAISQTTITNWDWSEDFDRQIKETANRTQQVRIAQQEAEVAAAQAQKLVKESQAKKEAAELDAQAAVLRAKGEADAKKEEADGIAYYNAQIAKNYQVEIRLKELEIELERAKHWNGKEVADVLVMTPNGTLTSVTSK